MMIKLGVSTTKIEYSTQIYMINQNVYHLCSWWASWNFYTTVITRSLKCMSKWAHSTWLTTWLVQNARKQSYAAKAALLFLFANEMKWGSTWKKVIFGIIKRKTWSKCYCRAPKRKQFTTIKRKVKNNRIILETLTSFTSTTKQNKKDNSYIPGGFSTKIMMQNDGELPF